MAYFERFDVCEAHYLVEYNYHDGGWLQERPSNLRRKEATHVQLDRVRFRISPTFKGYQSLTSNGKEIYRQLLVKYGFAKDEDVLCKYCGEVLENNKCYWCDNERFN